MNPAQTHTCTAQHESVAPAAAAPHLNPCSCSVPGPAPGQIPAQVPGYAPGAYNGPDLNGLQQTAVYPGASSPGSSFWTGALIGVGVALLLNNDKVQKTLMKGATTLYHAAQAGAEEVKEKFEDIRAEMAQSAEDKSK